MPYKCQIVQKTRGLLTTLPWSKDSALNVIKIIYRKKNAGNDLTVNHLVS